MTKTYRITGGQRLVNAWFALLTRRGLGARYRHILTVAGRATGLPRSTPVDVMTVFGSLSCRLNRGTASHPLFMVNYWLNNYRRLITDAQTINAFDRLYPYLRRCEQERDHLPNFVAVNFYNEGDLLRVVNRLNGVG